MNVELNKDWERISKGDVKTFELLYYKYYRRLCLYACSILSDEFLSEELVHDIFLKLWTNRKAIQITGSLKGYLFRATHNESLNAVKQKLTKKNTVNSTLPDEQWNGLEEIMNYDSFIIERLEANETENQINKAVESLPDQCKKIFRLSRIENLSNSEIAEKLNLSVNTVRGQIQKAIQKILQNL